MVTTNDDNLYTALCAYKEHGAGKIGAKTRILQYGNVETLDISEKPTELYDPYKYYNYIIGYNSRLDAIRAAMLTVKLRHLYEYNNNRAPIAKMYIDRLDNRIILPVYANDTKPC